MRLTPTEGRILQLLLAHAGRVLAAGRILGQLGGNTDERDASVIKTHVHHLRAKITRFPGGPWPIRPVPDGG